MADGSCAETEIGSGEGQMSVEISPEKKAEPEEDVYEVEKIVGMSTNKGNTLYRVRWVGYSPQWDTWEPYENLTSCSEMIDKYVEDQKKQKENKQDLDTDVFSRESSENDNIASPNIPKQQPPPSGDVVKKREKKPSYYYVGSSDDEADTLKDKFWRNLEEGKVDVFSSDLYSRAKGSRSAKPQSFSEMFESGNRWQNPGGNEGKDDKPKATKKRRKKSRTSLDSQQGDSKYDTDSVGSSESKTKGKAGSISGKGKGKGKPRRRNSKDSEASSKSSRTSSSKSRRTSVDSQGGENSTVRKNNISTNNAKPENVGVVEIQTETQASTPDPNLPSEHANSVQEETETAVIEEIEEIEDPVELVSYPACDSPTSQSSTNSEGTTTKWTNSDQVPPAPPGESLLQEKAVDVGSSLRHCHVVLERLQTDSEQPLAEEGGELITNNMCSTSANCINTSTCGVSVAKGGSSLAEESDAKAAADSQPAKTPDSFLDRISMLTKNYPLESDRGANAQSMALSDSQLSEDWDPKRRKVEQQTDAPVGNNWFLGDENREDSGLMHRVAPNVQSDSVPHSVRHSVPDSVPMRPMPLPVCQPDQRLRSPIGEALPVTSDAKYLSLSNFPDLQRGDLQRGDLQRGDLQRGSRWGVMEQQTVLPTQSAPVSAAISAAIIPPWTDDCLQSILPINSPDCAIVQNSKFGGDPRSDNRGVVWPENRGVVWPENRGVVHSDNRGVVLSDNRGLVPMGTVNNEDTDCLELDLSEISQEWQGKVIERKLSLEPLELSNEELRQAVRDNAYHRACRAFKSRRRYDLEQPDHQGNTLVMVTAQHGYDDMLEMLVFHGAQLDVENKAGATPLILAAEQGLRCTVELLVVMGAKMNEYARDGETALIKAVKRGYKSVARVLLDYGANFSSPNNGETPVKLAKLGSHPEMVEVINSHISKVTGEFENQVLLTLNNTASIICALFPMQCFTLRDGDKFRISFKHELQTARPGVGVLLFIAHGRITPHEVRCRFYGTCAVTAALLNGVQLQSLTEEGQFVLSFGPLQPGRNELDIYTVKAPTSRAKLVVCAYKAQLLGR